MNARAYYNEFDRYAAAWLRNLIAAGLIAPGDVDERDIRDVKPDDLRGYTQAHFFAGIGGWSLALRIAGVPDDRSLWTGSCPCQPFSAAGQRKAGADERHLWPGWFRLIRECRPDLIFGEQVEAAIGLGWLDRVFADLEAEDYACGALVLGAHSVGAPNIRQRTWWVAESGCERRDGKPIRLQPGRSHQAGAEVAGRRDARRLAHSDGREPRDGGLQRSGEHGLIAQDGGTGERVGEPAEGRRGPGRSGASLHGGDARSSLERPSVAIGMGDPTSGGQRDRAIPANPWSDAGLIQCTDGKARRVPQSVLQCLADGFSGDLADLPPEAGFPLAKGVEGRTGALRGFGNAINSYPAAEFIGAYLDLES